MSSQYGGGGGGGGGGGWEKGGVKVCFYEISTATIKHGRGHEHSF